MVFVVQLFKMPDTKATCALSLYYLKVMLVEYVGGLGRDADHPHRAGVVSGQRGRAARVVKLQYSPA